MSNRTAPKPSSTRARPKSASNGVGFRRTTARLEGRRDGKPLIFGWGRHLTRAQKNLYQHAAAYGFAGLVAFLVLAVLAFGWVQQTFIIPNQTIASVNQNNISQDTYRKHLAFDTQTLWNQIQSELARNTQMASDPKADPQKKAALIENIQADEANYSQSSLTQQAITELIEDQLIQGGAATFEQRNHVPASTFTPTSAAIDKQLEAFKKAFPVGETYTDFLAKDNLSDSDVRAAIAMQLRRTLMGNYLQTLLTDPMRQIRIRRIETNTMASAQKVYDLIVNKHGDWNALAKQYSLDVDSKNSGGDLNFQPLGSGDAGIETWAYAPGRKVNDITVLKDATGTFDVVQITDIQNSRGYDANKLSAAKSNALAHWLAGQKVASFTTLTGPNSGMLTASRNIPAIPNINAQLPSVAPSNAIPGSQNLPPGAG